MQRTYIQELKQNIGQEVCLKGWIQTRRDQGAIKFLILRDRTGLIQTVVLKSNTEAFAIAGDLTLESVVEIIGLVKEEKQAPGGFEIAASTIKVLSKSDPELPIPVVVEKSGDESDVTKRFDWRWIDLRRPEKLQIFRVWTELEKAFRAFFDAEGYIQVYTPSFMNAPSESGADVFQVDYFDRKAYLAQSPQFYKQMAMASGFERVFMVGPVYRAEPSFTTRHMTEFTGWDFEISFIESHFDIMDAEERLLASAFAHVKDVLGLDIDVPKLPFPKITMKEAKEKLAKQNVPSKCFYDVSPEEERILGEIIKKETGSDFVFLTDWPIDGRAFYHMRYADNPSITKGFDLIYKGIEVTTGAQREHRIEFLEKQAIEKGLSLESIKDYLNFFRYGCPPHGGVGMGPGRIIAALLGYSSVKEITYLPRDVKRLTP